MIRRVALCVFLGCVMLAQSSYARSKRHPKIFPATPMSVPQENADADRLGLIQYDNQEQVDEDTLYGVLVPFQSSKWLDISRALPVNRRVALRSTVAFVDTLAREFHEQFPKRRLVLDSAIRPMDCQISLRRHNRNATFAAGESASTHERGTTVDLGRNMGRKEFAWLAWRLMYYRGLGRIRVIEERRCIHIFVGGNHALEQ